MNIGQIPPLTLVNRFWLYQAERFPLIMHGLLIAAFSVSAMSFSILLRGGTTWPPLKTILVGFATAFLFFFQLRIADEFKDFEEDSRYRPYRPVPRGLVSLRELGVLGLLAALIQVGLALWLDPSLSLLLLLVWLYMGLMSQEFGMRDWLKTRPILYMGSHMVIVPLIDLYTTACDWWAVGAEIPHTGLLWFLVTSFFNGVVIELGRKIRSPQAEEPGVETYSALWGYRRAVLAWLGALLLTGLSAWLAAGEIGIAGPLGEVLIVLWLVAVLVARRFLQTPQQSRAKWIEAMSGIWTILMYLSLGVIPLWLHLGQIW